MFKSNIFGKVKNYINEMKIERKNKIQQTLAASLKQQFTNSKSGLERISDVRRAPISMAADELHPALLDAEQAKNLSDRKKGRRINKYFQIL